MTIPVKLSDIVHQMEGIPDEMSIYIQKTTGEFHAVMEEFRRIAEDGWEAGERPEWQVEQLEKAADIMENEENYLSLPSQFDIHEYAIMEDFCRSIEQSEVSGILLKAIRGSGAFRRFRSAIERHDIVERWYRFKEEALKEIARSWCEENGIEYTP